MKRVQILIEEWQHTWLHQEADRQSINVSALLRQLVTETIERQQTTSLSDDPLWGIIGMAEGPSDGVTSENLDQFLYNQIWQQSSLRIVAETELATNVSGDKVSYDKTDTSNR